MRLQPAFLGQPEQPVPELQRGEAVVFVVVGDPGEDCGRFVGPLIVPRVAEPCIGNHGGAGILHFASSKVRPHVERLELLDAVRVLGDPDAVPDRLVQVHQQAFAEPLVHDVLPGNVHHREFPKRRFFIRCVVVDVHVRVVPPAFLDIVKEIEERLLLRLPAVGPEWPENPRTAGLGGRLNHAEQVLEPPHSRGAVLPQRIAFEVEENIAPARWGQLGQGVPGQDAVADGVLFAVLAVADFAVGRANAALHPRLFLQAQERRCGLGEGRLRQVSD
ncbi:hypothetical protein SRABI128_05972 [Microbacterium sp. Bi128]|nr:hypothetical protein SRABI128_05972 [Microbacterium sp. Bi128]